METMLLDVLERNARMPAKELASIIGCDEKAVDKKIKELEDKHIIRGYNAVIDWAALGEEKADAFIEIKVLLSRGVSYDTIAERVYQYPEVTSMYLMSGSFDFGVFVRGKSMREVAMFVSQKLAIIDGITNTATQFILKSYKNTGIILEENERDEREAIS